MMSSLEEKKTNKTSALLFRVQAFAVILMLLTWIAAARAVRPRGDRHSGGGDVAALMGEDENPAMRCERQHACWKGNPDRQLAA